MSFFQTRISRVPIKLLLRARQLLIFSPMVLFRPERVVLSDHHGNQLFMPVSQKHVPNDNSSALANQNVSQAVLPVVVLCASIIISVNELRVVSVLTVPMVVLTTRPSVVSMERINNSSVQRMSLPAQPLLKLGPVVLLEKHGMHSQMHVLQKLVRKDNSSALANQNVSQAVLPVVVLCVSIITSVNELRVVSVLTVSTGEVMTE